MHQKNRSQKSYQKPKAENTNSGVIKNITTAVFAVGAIISIVLLYYIFKSKLLPAKFLIPAVIAIFAIEVALGYFIVFRKTKKMVLQTVLSVISIILDVAFCFGIYYLNHGINFINTITTETTSYIYDVVANSSSSYKSISDISGKTISYVKDNDELSTKLKDNISSQGSVDFNEAELESSILSEVASDKDKIAVVSSSAYESMADNDDSFSGKVRVIAVINIDQTSEVAKTDTTDMTNTPFIIFINGIDTRSGKLPTRSLSDVNILMAVNPKTRHILMVHVPRDSYVTVHGKNAKDKLTHTGSIGGVELTMATLEDFLDIKLEHYARANFNAVIGLVDAIGGIDIYNDQDHSISCWTDRSCTFNAGWNYNIGGKCALAFARERKSYETGDRHRGENQEQVMQAIINKSSSSSTILGNYSSILSSLSGSLETNATSDQITSLVRMQLNDMKSWTMETYNVTGTGTMSTTYSYPNQKLYVMIPDKSTVTTAKDKLEAVLSEK